MTTTPNITLHSDRTAASDLLKHPWEGTTELFLVRHGQTPANVAHLLVGSTDVALDELGECQALQVGKRFADIDAIATSPTLRICTTWRLAGQEANRAAAP